MKLFPFFLVLIALTFSSCEKHEEKVNFVELRKNHETKIIAQSKSTKTPEQPPANHFLLEKYSSPEGKMWMYITPKMTFRNSRPAVIWLSNTLDHPLNSQLWNEPKEFDLRPIKIKSYKIVTLIPSLRGRYNNPGQKELFYGELEDIKAAFNYLSQHPNVDPNQIFLVGHGEGATLALITAGNFQGFKAIYAIGPTANVAGDAQETPFDEESKLEPALRSPLNYLEYINTPTYIMEGKQMPTNLSSLRLLQKNNKNPKVKFIISAEHNHYSIVQHACETIVNQIVEQ